MLRCKHGDCDWQTAAIGRPAEEQYREHIKDEHIEEVDADIPEGMVQVMIQGEMVNVTPDLAEEVARVGGQVSDDWIETVLDHKHHVGYQLDWYGDRQRERDRIERDELLSLLDGDYHHDPEKCPDCGMMDQLLEEMEEDIPEEYQPESEQPWYTESDATDHSRW